MKLGRPGSAGVLARAAAVALAAVALPTGCIYFNALYNAERLFADAERARLDGADALAAARYDSAIAKAADGYSRNPEGGRADDALFLLGRAYVRQGDGRRAVAALRRAIDLTDDERIRLDATVFLGAATILAGDPLAGVTLLNRAFSTPDMEALLPEGYLWRGRALLALDRTTEGLQDLERAVAADSSLAVRVELERMKWGLTRGDPSLARLGAERLLSRASAHRRMDSLMNLIGAARRRWGVEVAADLLTAVDSSAWPDEWRDQLLLRRAELRLSGGDGEGAAADARALAARSGTSSVEARLLLAGIELAQLSDVRELAQVRALLVPVAHAPPALALLGTVMKVELLASRAGSDDPIALFAAAELARDELGAPGLARSLFLAYADRAGISPWVGKALLAVLDLAPAPEIEGGVLRRLASLDSNPYARAARTGWFSEAEFARLEGELRVALEGVLGEITAQVTRDGALLHERADTFF